LPAHFGTGRASRNGSPIQGLCLVHIAQGTGGSRLRCSLGTLTVPLLFTQSRQGIQMYMYISTFRI